MINIIIIILLVLNGSAVHIQESCDSRLCEVVPVSEWIIEYESIDYCSNVIYGGMYNDLNIDCSYLKINY